MAQKRAAILIFIPIAVVFFGALFIPARQPVLAGPLGGALDKLKIVAGPTQLADDLPTTIGAIIRGVLAVVGTVFFILTIYAGLLWMTSSGNEEKITKARDIIVAAVIGLLITLSAYAITYFVANKLGNSGGLSCAQYGDKPQCIPTNLKDFEDVCKANHGSTEDCRGNNLVCCGTE